ncbi:hypothetical protein CYMTET_36128 [Cymbomonas tetramitiformis]|uniref:Photolyase/cryptochrome alpha/beta domain-containing protein n=1 Tax=Cymbomonas tetramitiformis TaxID=36881 RepID=A0AAE0F7W6_9CHLO|nr:hypothetical protein CYMTET_36128 [Cymbomonas tetramitiformis]
MPRIKKKKFNRGHTHLLVELITSLLGDWGQHSLQGASFRRRSGGARRNVGRPRNWNTVALGFNHLAVQVLVDVGEMTPVGSVSVAKSEEYCFGGFSEAGTRLACSRTGMDVVWIKRDARLHDHGPFAHVGARPFCVLYCYEPDQLAHHSVHGSHIGFINEGLQDLDNALHSLAGSSHARTSHAADGNLNPPTGEFTQDSAYQQLSSGEPCSIFRSVREPHSDKPGRLCGEHCGQVDAPQGESQGGAPLRRVSIWKGEITTALESLNASPSGPVVRLLSHEETGHLASYRRDKRVRRWCREARVEWREFAQTGVRRHSRSEEAKIGPGGLRDAWSKSWSTFIFSPQHPTISATAARKAFRVTPASIHGHKAAAAGDELSHRAVGNATLRTSESERSRGELLWTANSEPATVSGYEVDGCLYSGERADWTGRLVTAVELGLEHPEERSQRQHGGEERAHHVLDSFLAARGEGYARGISSPLTAWDSCSRLSPYLAWGHMSLRQLVQVVHARQTALRAEKGRTGDGWLKSLQALRSRLQWRSHFMQKLECEPELECSNQCRSYDCLRTQEGGVHRGSGHSKRTVHGACRGITLVDGNTYLRGGRRVIPK